LSEAHRELREAKNHLESLIESSTDAIIATDREGKIVFFSEGAEILSGYKREEVVGKRGPVLHESETSAKEVMRLMRDGGGKLSAFETTFLAKDGTRIPVLISASILYDEEGREAGTVGFSKDLRERKRAEEELKTAHEELQQAYDTLGHAQAAAITSEKLAAVGRLTAGVSHEMLNPLNFITLCLRRLLDDPDINPELAEDLRDIQEHSNRIVKITQGLLSFSRQRTPERRSINLNDTVTKTLALLKYDLKLQNISLELNLAEGLPSIQADEDQLRQVVLSLLTNARDVMPKGGRLVLSTAEVEPLFADKEGAVELRVEDTGPGIPAEDMDKLFEPFFTTKSVGEGTGLGLSICQGIVEAHEGVIWAENVPGGGAAFIIHLNVEGENNAEQNLSG
jgi:two-component system NtrC family sensor kinase